MGEGILMYVIIVIFNLEINIIGIYFRIIVYCMNDNEFLN